MTSYPANASNTGYQNAPGYPGSLLDGSGLSIASGATVSFYNFPSGVGTSQFADGASAHDVTFIGCRFASNSVTNANVHTVGPGMTYKYCTFEPSTVAAGNEPAITNPTSRVAYANGYQYGILQDGSTRGAVTVQNCRFWGFGNAIQLDTSTQAKPFTIDTCLFQNARADGGVDHTDGPGQLTGSTSANYGVVRNCTVVGIGNTNALALQAGTYNGWTITGNYFAGYNYMVSIGTVTGNQQNMTFANNTWGSDASCEPALGPVYSNSVGSFPGTGQYGNYWYGNKMSTAAGTTWMAAGNDGLFWWPTDLNPAGPSSIIGHAGDFQMAPPGPSATWAAPVSDPGNDDDGHSAAIRGMLW